ncbi:hypothetical protein M8J76_009604 [Diaphorina citri]|nr:hypothetical protein M8J75_015694 [Diaphorina citri]KAI5722522.1 hypothetical protein M8J76_009604 [Diaphorina citri]KAI5724401.1 hypothetical protein M8J77_002157 [Diaphorina citri]
MGKNKKRFIDKKNAITFHLVHRSQKDPLLVDETAPQHVLKPMVSGNSKDKTKQKEEQIKYGIYFDDEYDYLQHLRDPTENPVAMERVFIPAKTRIKSAEIPKNDIETYVSPGAAASGGPRLQLPSSVFSSSHEETVGLLNKAAPESGLRLDLDPDIVAAMDEDFDYDDPNNQLEDDFVALANGNGGGDFEGDMYEDTTVMDNDNSDDYEDMSSDFDEDGDDFNENDERLKMFSKEETKSRFTEYSMSSSVIRRNENLSYLDDTFEQMFAKYDDTEIGALECEDIEGDIMTNDQRLLSVAEEFEKERQVEKFSTENTGINRCGRIAEESDTEDSSEDEFEKMVIREKEKWDCKSILSTYSNIYNHPTLITEPKTNKIKINPKTGIPITSVSTKLTPGLLAHHDNLHPGADPSTLSHKGPGSVISAISTLSIRPKNETPEERKARKSSLKEFRKERRVEKKSNRLAFKDEKKRVEKEFINKKVHAPGIHLA